MDFAALSEDLRRRILAVFFSPSNDLMSSFTIARPPSSQPEKRNNSGDVRSYTAMILGSSSFRGIMSGKIVAVSRDSATLLLLVNGLAFCSVFDAPVDCGGGVFCH